MENEKSVLQAHDISSTNKKINIVESRIQLSKTLLSTFLTSMLLKIISSLFYFIYSTQ